MRVRYYPTKKFDKSSNIVQFLRRQSIHYELIQPEEVTAYNHSLHHLGELPIVEIDGRVFINPNEDALKKIFRVA